MDETASTIQECRRAECRLRRPLCTSVCPMYSRLTASLAYSCALGPMDCLHPADYKNAKTLEPTVDRPGPTGGKPEPMGDMPELTDDRLEPMGGRPGPGPGLRLCCC